MSTLQAAVAAIDLKDAKATGLADLGVPLGDDTRVKKGKLAEFTQPLADGRPGRRFQNIKVTAVLAREGGEPGAQVLLSFEVFGDDHTPVAPPAGLKLQLRAGSEVLAELPLPPLYLPYACCWYENRFAVRVPADAVARADALSLVAPSEAVRCFALAAGA